MPVSKRTVAVLLAVLAMIAAATTFAVSANAAPYATAATLSVSNQTPVEGGSFVVSLSGFRANEGITLTLGSTVLATGTTDSSGSFSSTVTLPPGVTGQQTIVGTGASGDTSSVTITIGAASAAGSSGGSSGGLPDTGVAVIGVGVLGVLLLIGGGFLLIAGKRRRSQVSA